MILILRHDWQTYCLTASDFVYILNSGSDCAESHVSKIIMTFKLHFVSDFWESIINYLFITNRKLVKNKFWVVIPGYYLERYKMSETTIQDHTKQKQSSNYKKKNIYIYIHFFKCFCDPKTCKFLIFLKSIWVFVSTAFCVKSLCKLNPKTVLKILAISSLDLSYYWNVVHKFMIVVDI